MSLTKAQRDAIPAEDFAGPGRTFPCDTQEHLNAAAHLIGKAANSDAVKRKAIAIAKRKGLTLPDAWKDDAAKMSLAAFSLTGEGKRIEGDYVIYPNSLLFKAGDYPDKKLSFSPEDLFIAADQYTGGAKVNFEHSVTPFLKDRLGDVRSVRFDTDGETLRGEIAIPKWLDDAAPDGGFKLSAELERIGEEPWLFTGVALTDSPRVSQAALMSAYATFATRHNTPQGQRAIQDMHDQAARAGAVCKPPSAANMASSHEATAIQQIHDTAVSHGATCASGNASSWFAKDKDSAAPGGSDTTKGKPMSLKDRLKALFTKAGETAPTDEEIAEFTTNPEVAELKKQLETANRQIAAFSTTSSDRDATEFAERQIKARKAIPSEKNAIIAQFRQASADDAALSNKVTFSVVKEGGAVESAEGTRIQALVAAFDARPAHTLTREMLKDAAESGELVQLLNREKADDPDANKPASPDRRKALMSMTDLGKTVLADEKGGK